MKKITDRVGNEIHEGDIVTVLVKGPVLVSGKVMGVEQTGMVRMILEAAMAFDPERDAVMGDVIKLVTPKTNGIEVVSEPEMVKNLTGKKGVAKAQ